MKLLKIISFVFLTTFIVGCEDDFLDKPIVDRLEQANFWKTKTDLELYVNQFYGAFPQWYNNQYNGGIYWQDVNSDNLAGITANNRLNGEATIDSGNGAWGFGSIRRTNIFMKYYENVDDDFDNYKHYVGEALFFRAYYNFNLLKNFGAFPYIDKVLTEVDEELYSPRTERNVVAQNIINDLDDAISYMKSGKQKGGNRLSKEIALLFQARVALYEGTWEKYHAGTVFGVTGSNGSAFLEIAKNASHNLILSGVHQLNTEGVATEGTAYYKTFNQSDYSGNKEVMLWKKFDKELDQAHNAQRYLSRNGGGRGVTKSLVDDYLCMDGKPIATSPLYLGDANLIDVTTNRDPRLSQTIWLPGQPTDVTNGTVNSSFTLPSLDDIPEQICTTGYQIRKGSNPNSDFKVIRSGTTSSPIFRYAEALLIFAEAKAELGSITQADLDISINKLRDRVGMPHLNMNTIENDPNWLYPDLSPLINEIRRETRVEFAVEGYRATDLMRWNAHSYVTVGKQPLGAKFNPADFPSATVQLDANGYISPYKSELPSGFEFVQNRDYLLAIPEYQIELNSNLTQNPGWEQ